MSPVLSLLLSLVLSDSPKLSPRPRHRREARRRFAPRRLHVEALEDRTVPTAVALPSNAVSWWTANNTANDAQGLNNATLSNVTYTTGEVGQAFSFNGTNSWASLGDPSSLAFTQSFTIEGWIKVNGLPASGYGPSIMFRGDDRGGLDPYVLSVQPNDNLQFTIGNAAGTNTTIDALIPLGQFVHVAATLDDATGAMTLYENGAVVAQTTTTVRPFATLDPTQNPGVGIGNSNYEPNFNVPFNGPIDELTVYNRALTANEVLGIYKAGSSGKVISPIAVTGSSVVNGSGSVTFTITRANTSGSLAVNWATADDTAKAGTNYVAASGTVTFADGQATQTVTVTTLNDTTPEPTVTFDLVATPAGGTSVMGVSTILANTSTISVSDAPALEGSNTLKFLDHFIDPGSGGLTAARSSVFGPDGNLYVASAATNAILRYDPTGEFLNAFVPSGSGGLDSPCDLAFGPDGDLYVSSANNGEVVRYDGASGAFLGVVASGLSGPWGLTFGPDGSLYIANEGTHEVLRYNSSGLSSFVTAGSGGLKSPRKAVFGPDGNLYVASAGTGQVLRYNGQTGAFMDVFATAPSTPLWLEFGTDGYLYTTVRTSGPNCSIVRFNAATGAYLDSFALGRDGQHFNLGTGNIVYDSSDTAGGFVDRIGPSSIAAFTVSLAWPSAATTTVSYATADGTAHAGTNYTAAGGTLTFAPGETAKGILVPTLDSGSQTTSLTFTVNLSNPQAATLTRGQATGTIAPSDVTAKFYVVNNPNFGGSRATFKYQASGTEQAPFFLGSTNLDPFGIAANAAGTEEWVVDSNENVYAYSPGGTLLGSWSAGGLPSGASLNGIATDGTNIWLLDATTNKIFEYAGAASRLSGSQNASSSFKVTRGDSFPANIVTDGKSMWVVDGGNGKVYKYTVAGKLLGSWATDPANVDPVGITIDPNHVSDIWIVDGTTLKVYDYTAAASRTSGSQNAAATFALAPGNTGPVGIADPPPADMFLTPVAASLALGQPSVAAFNAVSPGGPSTVTGVPSLAGRDAVFALLARDSLQEAGGALTPHLDSPTPVADRALTPAGASGGQTAVDHLTALTPGSSLGFRSERSAVGLLDGALADEVSQVSAVATDSFFGSLADDAPVEE